MKKGKAMLKVIGETKENNDIIVIARVSKQNAIALSELSENGIFEMETGGTESPYAIFSVMGQIATFAVNIADYDSDGYIKGYSELEYVYDLIATDMQTIGAAI